MGTIKRFNIRNYIHSYNLKYFVETGTFYGDGVDYANQFNFEKIFSYEIFEPIFNHAKSRFSADSKIEIINEDSGTHMCKIDNKIKGNTLFFLDAHFPGADGKFTDYIDEKNKDINLPLQNELMYILTRAGTYKDVIIIDDMRLFVDDSRIESHKLEEHLSNIGKNYIKRDHLVHFDIHSLLSNEITTCYNVELDFRDEGYFILTPKL